MASANEAGKLEVCMITAEGDVKVVHTYRSDGPINAGKSPDGVLANLTVDKWMFMPRAGPVGTGGCKIGIRFTPDAADGLDVSDGVIQIPVTYSDGGVRYLNATDIGNTTDFPAATPAANPYFLGAGWTVPNGIRVMIGGGPVVISVEDDS